MRGEGFWFGSAKMRKEVLKCEYPENVLVYDNPEYGL